MKLSSSLSLVTDNKINKMTNISNQQMKTRVSIRVIMIKGSIQVRIWIHCSYRTMEVNFKWMMAMKKNSSFRVVDLGMKISNKMTA